MPSPRATRGFIVTTPIAHAIPAALLQEHDAFALPEAIDDHLIVQSTQPHPALATRLAIQALGKAAPLTVVAGSLRLTPRSLPKVDPPCLIMEGAERGGLG
ncbi:hypothetical protein AB0I84_40475, partial [Streptomyces spectabilis]|uniref:hypothetical protein n=1 Tax=Streptomyces spectabilis TaxID=68270 RepID=UPI0033FA0D97